MKDKNKTRGEKCPLCGKVVDEIRMSHIIPSFVGKWLKETSVTGYLRQGQNANVRVQDIVKKKLLCSDCEIGLSLNEKLFAENIFKPYTTQELNEWAVAQGKIKHFVYGEWFTQFVIGMQWKALLTNSDLSEMDNIDEITKKAYAYKIESILEIWRKFLLGKSKYSGSSSHYIIFLQNLITGKGYLPDRVPDRINMYLIRSIDSTLAVAKKSIYLYTKLGPIIILSTITPSKLKGIKGGIIKKRGIVMTAQKLINPNINEFIFITRPNEVYSNYSLSEKQKKIIDRDTEKKIGSAKSIQTVLVARSDILLKKSRESRG